MTAINAKKPMTAISGVKLQKKNRITEKITYNNDFFSETYC